MKQIVFALFFIFLAGEAFSAETFIVGGEDAQTGQFPWIGGIEYVEYAFVCAGAVISDHWFLTAAHCVYFLTPDAVRLIPNRPNSPKNLESDQILPNRFASVWEVASEKLVVNFMR